MDGMKERAGTVHSHNWQLAEYRPSRSRGSLSGVPLGTLPATATFVCECGGFKTTIKESGNEVSEDIK